MTKNLTQEDFINAAKILRCDVAAIKAVAEVESSGNGFLIDETIKVLFEGHVFYKYTNGRFKNSDPTLCYPNWTREFYAKGATADIRGHKEWNRLQSAMALDDNAALMSASYGKFQIMGFNYVHCGFKSINDFFMVMQVNEGEQIKAFCKYIQDVGLDDELRKHSWGDFAHKYNGPDYKKNKYDLKLAAAWVKYA
ncbi:MAG: N-acetylmuramidase family protein [Leclercia adecarboxylata]|nr:N-acetylmuramidase domain-containing protein [uncultured Leclercia sp.]MDU4841787.1 N-acetylmuramidase family protein [Leclercia adecarboxylata]